MIRQYSNWAQVKAGASLEQRVVVAFNENNYVTSTYSSFTTDNLDLANNIYIAMFQNLKKQYGEPKKTFTGENMPNSAKWIINNHVYEISEIIKAKSIYVYLMIRPIKNSDLM